MCHAFFFSSTLPWVRVGTIIPTLQKRKLRLREIRQGIQRHSISEWLNEGSNAGLIHGTWIQGITSVLRERTGCPRVPRLSAQDPGPLEDLWGLIPFAVFSNKLYVSRQVSRGQQCTNYVEE